MILLKMRFHWKSVVFYFAVVVVVICSNCFVESTVVPTSQPSQQPTSHPTTVVDSYRGLVIAGTGTAAYSGDNAIS